MMKDLLENKNFFKLVCGAGNEDADEIEKLVYVYAKAGCKVFDLSANIDIVKIAHKALAKAEVKDAYICISVGIKGDPHTNKALIDQNICKKCDKCKKICPQNAILEDIHSNYVKSKKCIGCGKCLQSCQFGAISIYEKEINFEEILPPIIDTGIDCLEFHATIKNNFEVLEKWNLLNSIYDGMMSICIDRSNLSNEELVQRIKKMTQKREPYTTIVQADGAPMSGGVNDYRTTLQAVATAEIVLKENIPVYVTLSGGTNSKTAELAKLCGLNISGIAIGSFARKIIKEYVEDKNFWNDTLLQNGAIKKAKELINKSICI